MRTAAVGLLGVLELLSGTGLAAQTVTNGDVSVRITGRIQAQYSTTSVGSEDLGDAGGSVPSGMFETRRVRLVADITIREWITGMIEPDFAGGSVQLRHGFVNFAFTDAFQLKVGQFKKPFSGIQLESSLTIPSIERGMRIRGLGEALSAADQAAGAPVLTPFGGRPLLGEEQSLLDALGYQGYDLGAQVHGGSGAWGWAVGLFNGGGANRAEENDAKSAAARVSWEADAVPLKLAAGVGYQERLQPTRDGTAFELDAEWGGFRRPGVRLLGELVTGGTVAADDRFLGIQGMASWFYPIASSRVEGIEPVGRVSFGNPRADVEGDAGVLLTPGINVYFFGRNRLQLNWDVYVPEGDRFETTHALRAQAQLHF